MQRDAHVKQMRGVNDMLKSKGLRKRFVKVCLADKPAWVQNIFKSYKAVDIDQKWVCG